MPWKEVSSMEQKHRFVTLSQNARSNRSVDSAKSSESAAKVAISGGSVTAGGLLGLEGVDVAGGSRRRKVPDCESLGREKGLMRQESDGRPV